MKRTELYSALSKGLISAFLLVLVLSTSLSGAESAGEIIDKIQKKYDDLIDATLNFTQKVKFNLSKAEYTSSGTIYMKKVNHYRIEMDDRTFVTDGKTVWSYSPVNKQLLVDTYKDDPRSFSPERFLLSVPKDYYSAILSREKVQGQNVVVLKLTPKDEKASMRSIKLWVHEGEWLLRKAEIVDVSNNVTVYAVLNIRLNTAISDSTFSFVAPPGVEVIDLR